MVGSQTNFKNGLIKNGIDVVDENRLFSYLPVGIPQPWPQATPPDGWIICDGRKIDKDKYPKLAQVYTSGYLPDLRGEFIRGLDSGRNIDLNREVLSNQGDAIRNITGKFGLESAVSGSSGIPEVSGVFYTRDTYSRMRLSSAVDSFNQDLYFDSSIVVPTANENRPRNIAFLYIVKAE